MISGWFISESGQSHLMDIRKLMGTDFDDWVKPEHSSRISAVWRQWNSSVGRDAEILACRHVTEPNLLFPAYHVACASNQHHRRHVTNYVRRPKQVEIATLRAQGFTPFNDSSLSSLPSLDIPPLNFPPFLFPLPLKIGPLTLWRPLFPYGQRYYPVPDRVKPSFVTFDIRAFWRSGLSVRVPGCQKLQITA